MSDTQVGGNGSVHWLMRPDKTEPDGPPLKKRRMKDGKWTQHGVDYDKDGDGQGETFTIRIKLPEGADVRAWGAIGRIVSYGGDRVVEIELPIENDPKRAHTQVQVTWGQKAGWDDGLGRLSDELTPPGAARV
jgi:hypothetical protein